MRKDPHADEACPKSGPRGQWLFPQPLAVVGLDSNEQAISLPLGYYTVRRTLQGAGVSSEGTSQLAVVSSCSLCFSSFFLFFLSLGLFAMRFPRYFGRFSCVKQAVQAPLANLRNMCLGLLRTRGSFIRSGPLQLSLSMEIQRRRYEEERSKRINEQTK